MTLSLYGQGKDFGKEASTSVSIYPGRWANLEYRSGPKLSIEVGQTGLSKPPVLLRFLFPVAGAVPVSLWAGSPEQPDGPLLHWVRAQSRPQTLLKGSHGF